MPALEPTEVRPGVVVQLDTIALRASGQAYTNAELTTAYDRAVEGEHSFVVLEVDARTQIALLTPVFSDWAPGSQQLKEVFKAGHQPLWLAVALYFNQWQHWQIPVQSIVAYSTPEATPIGQRRWYAIGNGAELGRIAAYRLQNRAPWRVVTR